MTFPANETEAALAAAARGEQTVEQWLVGAQSASVLVPIAESTPPDPGGDTPPHASYPVMVVDGQSYVPAYTSAEQWTLAGQPGGGASMTLAMLVRSLPATLGVAVNPGGTLGLPLAAGPLRAALDAVVAVPAGSRVYIGDPAQEPTELLAALGAAWSRVAAVRQARRCWVSVERATPRLVVGVDLEPDHPETRDLVMSALDDLTGPAGVDVVFVNDGGPFVEWMWSHTEPFYVSA